MVLTVTREAIKHVLLQNGAGVREGRVSLKMIACKTFKICLFVSFDLFLKKGKLVSHL